MVSIVSSMDVQGFEGQLEEREVQKCFDSFDLVLQWGWQLLVCKHDWEWIMVPPLWAYRRNIWIHHSEESKGSQFLPEKCWFFFLFCSSEDILIEITKPGKIINHFWYCEILDWLYVTIKNNQLGKLTNGIILLHKNAFTYVTSIVTEKVEV